MRVNGKAVPPVLLRMAEFSLAPTDSKDYCYIDTTEGEFGLTRRESHLLSKESIEDTAQFRTFLAEQENPIRRKWKD